MLAVALDVRSGGSRVRARVGPRLLALALALAAPAQASASAEEPARPLLFLANKNIPPIVYLEGDDPAGLAVDLVRALAPHLSRPVELRAMDWSAAQALVFRGDADALIQMNPSEERHKLYDFSTPLLESQFSIFMRRDSLAIPGPAGLRGLTVGVEAGGLPEQVLSRDPAVRLVTIPDFRTGFGLLTAYDLDAVVVDWRVGSYVLARNGIRDVTVRGEPVAYSRSAIAVKKGNAPLLAELDAALSAIRADGTYDRILERWQPKEVVLWTREQIVRAVAGGAVVLLAVVLLTTGLWMMALRRELRRRREAEAQLTARNAVLDGVLSAADAAIHSVDREYRYTSFNAEHAAVMRAAFGAEVSPGRCVLDLLTIPEEREGARRAYDRALAGEQVVTEAWLGPAPQRFYRISFSPIRADGGAVAGVAVLAQDLTERRQAEETIRRINRELRALTSSNKSLMRATDEATLLRDVCHIICEEAGYRMAWVGYASSDEDRRIVPMASAGFEEGYLATAALTWADTERGRGPSGTALRTGVTACIQDFEVDSSAGPWREAALARGYRSSTALPLEDAEGRTFGVLCIYASQPGAFTPDERRLLEELAGDLALGLTVLRARADLQRAEAQRSAHLHFLESMDRVNRAIAGAGDLEGMAGDVLQVVLSMFGCDRAFLLYPCDPEAPSWRVPVERCNPAYPGAQHLEVPMDPEVAQTLRVLLASDAPVKFGPGTPHPVPSLAAERFSLRSFMAMAIRPRVGKPWQFGIHQCARARTWTVDEEWLFQEIGRRLADAISTALVVRDLRESEARLAKAERMVQAGWWDADLAGGRIEHSEEAARIYGLPDGRRSWDLAEWTERWQAMVDPADRDRTGGAIMAAIGPDGPRYDLEYRITRPDGAVRWIHSQGEVTRDGVGRATRILGTMQDVTERRRAEEALRRSEEQYRRIVETTHEGIWVIDAGGRTTFVNRQMAQMLRASVEALAGVPIAEFLDEEDLGLVGEGLQRRAGGRGEQRELRLLRQDGTELWALVELTPFFDEGRYTGALAMVTDVTERRAIEAQLRQSQKLEAVGRLAGGVAHDFNNLLTAILSDARVLADGLGPDNPLRTEATEIEAAARKAALLTRQLLAFGRKQRSEPRIVDVGEVVASMDRMLRRLIGEDVELTTVTAPGLGRIRVDPVQLEQVLLNLAVNARDAMPRGGRLVIEAANARGPGADEAGQAEAGRWVMLAVRDTGLGMSPDVQAHLFEPFFTTKEPGKGTGLGLATVYGIVTQAGGEVRVRTEPGKGTAFEVFFPRVDAPAEEPRAPAPRELPRGTETVLVVEDEPLVRALAVRVLRSAGYDVLDAGDPEQALRLVAAGSRSRIDLLLTDVVMPRGSGPELATRLRTQLPELPVLFASGYMDRIQEVQSQLGRRTGFIPKPFTPDELARKVRELLEERAAAEPAASGS